MSCGWSSITRPLNFVSPSIAAAIETHPRMRETGVCSVCWARQEEVEDNVVVGSCGGSIVWRDERRRASNTAVALRRASSEITFQWPQF